MIDVSRSHDAMGSPDVAGDRLNIRITDDYNLFHPTVYLDEYYRGLSDENKFLLRFYHDAYLRIGPQASLLEVGGGPTIYQLISASRCVSRIVFSEFLEANRNEVRNWLARSPLAFDWGEYLQFVAMLEIDQTIGTPHEHVECRLRDRIAAVVPCDLSLPNPLAPNQHPPFDVVSSSFCIEGIKGDGVSFHSFLKNAISQLKPGGTLVLALVKDCCHYKVGDQRFPAFPVNEMSMECLLRQLGFSEISLQSYMADGSQGYSGLMGITAVKQNGT
jgi:hypothetical protein